MMSTTSEYYCVASHRFSVTGDRRYLSLMDNYQPFSAGDKNFYGSEKFAFDIVSDSLPPAFEEDFRQVDDEQITLSGTTSDGSHVFGFQWQGEMAGWLVCSEDYRTGRLFPTGKFTKLAIDNALMIMYALATAADSTLLFHAAVVSHEGRGYMFLGPSGTGKSTHARLWLRHIPGTTLVNDDNPVVRYDDDGVVRVYGSPWSGKTPCYRNERYPLGAIVLLSQAPRNQIRPLKGIPAYAAIMASISGTRWDRRIADGLHSTETRLVASVPVWHLDCLPDKESSLLCQKAITSPTWSLTNK